MNLATKRRLRNIITTLALVIVLILIAFITVAQDVDVRQSNDQNLQTTGDVSIGSKNSSFALAQALGDVDIGRAADCIVTEQYGIIVWQRQYTEYDEWCLAAILDRQGLHGEAAIMRCSDKATAKLYGDTCAKRLTFKSPPAPPLLIEEVIIFADEDDDDEIRYQEQQEELDYMQEQLATIIEQQQIQQQQAVPVLVQKQPQYSENDRARVKAILAGKGGSE